MKRRQVIELFAVVALAQAGCERDVAEAKAPAPQPQPESQPQPQPQPELQPQPRRVRAGGMPSAVPRTLRNGRPACGNIASRAPRPASCEDK